MALRDYAIKNRIPAEGQWQAERFDHGTDYVFFQNGLEYHVLVYLPEKVFPGQAEPNVSIEIVSSKPVGKLYATYFRKEKNGSISFELERSKEDEEKPEVTIGGEAELLKISENGERKYGVKIGDRRYDLPLVLIDADVSNFVQAVELDPEYEGFILPVSEAGTE